MYTDISLGFAVKCLGRWSHPMKETQVSAVWGLGGCPLMKAVVPSYHGFIEVSTTLEFKNSIGICWVALGVFANRPFFRLSLCLFVVLFIFAGSYTWQRGNMLIGELATATPENKSKAGSLGNIFPFPFH
jgi:hypothetical protein